MLKEDTVKLLADIGFMASSAGLSKHAFAIYSGIETARPDSILPDIGFALEFMNRKKFQEAISILEKQALKKSPDDPIATAFIGLALMMDGRNKESEDCLTKVEKSTGKEAVTMAKALLEKIRGK
ncbi:hypothetical protein CI610_00599 [invertebrate metagenome]|uniref:Uncharacterized protein n=1 Tax=invertebrate metagenome TaxID=1711999 RepID=A0A2H9TAZ1_9ZZZZ